MTFSIRRRIVVWYTLWLLLIVTAVMAFVFSRSGAAVERISREMLTERIQDSLEELSFKHGRLEIDDIEPYDDGVYIALYDMNGEVIAGRLPSFVPDARHSEDVQRIESEDGIWFIQDAYFYGYRLRGAMRYQDLSAFFSVLTEESVAVVFVLALLSALGGYIIVRISFRPVGAVIESADRIADGDDLSKRIGLKDRPGEIHQIAASFDRMLERLEVSFEKERRFSDDASHELRTPISVILAECNYAESHIDDENEVTNAIKRIEAQAGRMSRLVSLLLMLARSDKSTLEAKKEDVDLTELGEMVIDAMEDAAEEKHITLSLISDNRIHAYCDQDMLAAIMINLISNAIRYGRDGGFAKLSIKEEGENVVLSLSDNGIGIAEKDLPYIWDRFYRVDSSRSGDGTGLGLSIVKVLTALHGGQTKVESRLGEGSTFTVIIPAK